MWLSVLLLIVGCCGMSTLASTLQGASWATTVGGNGTVFTSFYGLCSKPPGFIFNMTNTTTTEDIQCKSWEDMRECDDDNDAVDLDPFYQRVCRTKGLKHWLGFCMIMSFFITLAFTVFLVFRRVTDSPRRKKGAIITGVIAWFFLVITFGSFSANCLPRGDRSDVAKEDLYFVPGPGMGSTVAVWFFVFLFLPFIIIMAPQNAAPRARYMPRETPTITGMP